VQARLGFYETASKPMKSSVRLTAIALLTLLVFGVVEAQYTSEGLLARLVRAERLSSQTVRISITVNNNPANLLSRGNSPTGETDRNGYNVVEIGADQPALPIVGTLLRGFPSPSLLRLEGTDLLWYVRVNRNGMFLTNFPLTTFPPGDYYMTLNGVRLFRIRIPENHSP
jgi:hypothetical protein